MKRKLYFDIEKSPEIAAVYEPFDAKVVWKVERSIMFSISYAIDDGPIHCVTNADFPAFKKNPHDDYGVTKKAWELLNTPDIIPIAHNGDNFDLKVLNTHFVLHGLPPVNPSRSVDTLKIARRNFKFFGNSLDSLAEFFGIGGKIKKKPGTDKACFEGDEKAYKEMKKYNNHDVHLLREIYKKLAPFHSTHPHVDPEMGSLACPNCGSTDIRSKGIERLVMGVKECLKCHDCGRRFYGKLKKLD